MKLLLFALVVFGTSSARALDIYSLIESTCQVHSGLIVGITPTNIEMLSLEGNYEIVPRANINNIVIFTPIQNPIPRIRLTAPLVEHAKNIKFSEEDQSEFVGWPIRFIEDLVVFYDLNGKTHIHELTDVTGISNYRQPGDKEQIKVADSAPANLNFTDVNSQCVPKKQMTKDSIGPTRIMSDKISISEFLTNFEKGFQNVESYQERTKFYPKPFLYEKRSRLGVIIFKEYKENYPILPVYFQWSTGKPYRFQSFTIFGSAPSSYLPIAEPVSGVQSDLKSHFFNATFVGNLVALPAGSSYFVEGGARFLQDVQAINQFNYMALMGGDYGPYSLSFGTYFPIFAYQVKVDQYDYDVREVLATSFSPAFRFMFTKGRFRVRAITSWSSASGSGNDNTKLKLVSTSNVTPDSFRLTGGYVRGGVDYKISDELKVSADEIYSVSNYSETTGSTQYFFNAKHATTSVWLEQSFGYYIAVSAYLNFFNNQDNYSFPLATKNTTKQDYSFGGALEFVF